MDEDRIMEWAFIIGTALCVALLVVSIIFDGGVGRGSGGDFSVPVGNHVMKPAMGRGF
jgi:hypothetical protein